MSEVRNFCNRLEGLEIKVEMFSEQFLFCLCGRCYMLYGQVVISADKKSLLSRDQRI